MSAITIDGDLVHYEKLGRGRPVILIHGWLGSWRYWIPTMQQLHLKYSVYTLDLMGFGDSAKNPNKYTIDNQAKLLNQFMEQLGIPKAAMIGHGLGSMVLARFALNHPDKVARMLLVSSPLLDPGDLKSRTPAGVRVLLTPSRDRFSMAPQLSEDDLQASQDKTLARSPLANMKMNQPNPIKELERDTSSKPLLKPEGETPASVGATATDTPKQSLSSPMDAVITSTVPPIPAPDSPDATVPSRADLAAAIASQHPPELPTLQTIAPDDRRRLMEAAAQNPAYASINISNDTANQLLESFSGRTLASLLDRCFKKTEVTYDKLKVDVDKTDEKILLISVQGYNAGRFLDDLRRVTSPTVAVHGMDDPVLPTPSDDVWMYLTVDKDDVFVPIPLPNVRHFPMLEYEPFTRLASDFLETPEIKSLEVRERWRRRSR
jgi:pimeloyl-ACP methyl ester carboxylesterase